MGMTRLARWGNRCVVRLVLVPARRVDRFVRNMLPTVCRCAVVRYVCAS